MKIRSGQSNKFQFVCPSLPWRITVLWGIFYRSISGNVSPFHTAVPSGFTVAQIVGMLLEYMVRVTLPSWDSVPEMMA